MFIDSKFCIACGMCLEECPFTAIEIKDGGSYSQSIIDQNKCRNCKTCIIDFECPANAIKEN